MHDGEFVPLVECMFLDFCDSLREEDFHGFHVVLVISKLLDIPGISFKISDDDMVGFLLVESLECFCDILNVCVNSLLIVSRCF